MSKQYKAINPVKYYKDYLSNNIRPDGRNFTKFRSIALNVDSISTADGSAIVKLGNTTVVCGIKAELCKPKAEEPDKGFLVPNVDLSPLSSSRFRPGPPSDQAQVFSRLVADIIIDTECIDLKKLCIHPDQLAWVLYCDIICLDYDGGVVDAAVIALVSALKTVKLPKVDFDEELFTVKCVDVENKELLEVHAVPVANTFVIFDDEQLIVDPTAEEEDLCNGSITVVIVDDHVRSVHKPGGVPISNINIEACIAETKKQAKYVVNLINTTFSENCKKMCKSSKDINISIEAYMK
ncbi:exosome complex component RRP43-like [Chrysoperla carnea]|uniref:exosome complex component RRP43-like n=1 Tax=Chrysoperla carnea TaxID=189513 RepID=UPI001D090035|nr:exosome complex component RRP43-like [Chrysoperla carnea]